MNLQTDTSGRYGAAGLQPGPWRVIMQVPQGLDPTGDTDGGTDHTVRVVLLAGDVAQADVGFAGNARVRLTVLDSSGRPFTGPVTVRWEHGGIWFSTTVQAVNGIVEVANVGVGTVTVESVGGVTTSTVVQVTDPTGTTTGTVRAPAALPVTGSAVLVPLALAGGLALLGALLIIAPRCRTR